MKDKKIYMRLVRLRLLEIAAEFINPEDFSSDVGSSVAKAYKSILNFQFGGETTGLIGNALNALNSITERLDSKEVKKLVSKDSFLKPGVSSLKDDIQGFVDNLPFMKPADIGINISQIKQDFHYMLGSHPAFNELMGGAWGDFNTLSKLGNVLLEIDGKNANIVSEGERAYGSPEKAKSEIEKVADNIGRTSGNDLRTATSIQQKRNTEVAEGLRKRGFVDFRGIGVSSPHEIANLAATFRHPKLEHFQVIYLKNNKIVAHRVVSSGKPDYIFTDPKFLQQIKEASDRLGSDAIYFAHNHPSGNPAPSSSDANFTSLARTKLGPLVKGHIITDGGEYSIITTKPDMRAVSKTYSYKKEFENYRKLSTKLPESRLRLLEIAAEFMGDVNQIVEEYLTASGYWKSLRSLLGMSQLKQS